MGCMVADVSAKLAQSQAELGPSWQQVALKSGLYESRVRSDGELHVFRVLLGRFIIETWSMLGKLKA